MIDPIPKQVLCPGSESVPKRQHLLWQSDRVRLFGACRVKFLPRKSPKGHKVANFPQACLKTEGSFPPERIGNGIF